MAALHTQRSARANGAIRAALAIGLLLGGAYFAYRGPYRALTTPGPDLPVFFSAGHAWVAGENPYEAAVLQRIIEREGGPTREILPMINPPTALPLFAAFAAVSFPTANALVTIANVLLAGLIPVLLWRGFGDEMPRGVALGVFAVLALMWAPTHTSISQGQNTLVAMALLLVGVLASQRRSGVWAGIAFALGAAVRPTFFLILPIWYALQLKRTWLIGVVAAVVAGGLLAAGIARLEVADVPWRATFADNVAAFRYADENGDNAGIGSLHPTRPGRFIMINLQPLLATWFDQSPLTHYAPLAIGVVVGLLAWSWRPRGATGGGTQLDLLTLAIYVTVSLLAIYNRSYSAVMLLIPLAWALGAWHDSRVRWYARATLICLLVFLAPLPAWLFARFGREALNEAWWALLVLPHQTYALLAATGLMLWAVRARAANQTATLGSTTESGT